MLHWIQVSYMFRSPTKNYEALYLRPNGDKRKDYVVKRQIYEESVKDKFNVLFVLEDRDQVVKMWREIGLTCFQVEYGDF